jgi:cellulose biosynthesis protein BcsQ
MYKIAFHIEKGGAGKTTMAGNTAFEISKHKKTIMIDCDPQGNLSSWYCVNPMSYELADVVQDKVTLKDVVINIRENLDIIPSFGIGGTLKDWGETALFQKPYAFPDLMEKLKDEGYEVAIFDLSPGISNLEKSILSCMDEVVGVAAAEYFSVDGLEIFNYEIEKLRKDRRARFVSNKLIVNRVNKSYALHTGYQDQFDKLEYEIFTVGQSTGISDCVPFHQSVFEYDSKNKNIKEFQRLAQAIIDPQRRL